MPASFSRTSRRRVLIGLSTAAVVAGLVPLWRRRRDEASTKATPATAAATAPAPAPAASGAAQSSFVRPLRLPGNDPLLTEIAVGNALQLHARIDAFALLSGATTPLWHYATTVAGQSVANPLLRAARGDQIDVTLTNDLDESTTLHWHGLSVDEANDGSGLHPVEAGAERRYTLRVDNRAGLYWYHAHPHGRTGKQIQRGLAGLILIEDEEERALRAKLRLPWGKRDIPLMIADKQIDSTNAIVYKQNPDDWIGNRVLVNWTPEPHLEVAPSLYRFRLINTCNARLLRPAFLHRGRPLPFQLIGTDGGLLERPWRINDIFLAPAQRIDVLVNLAGIAPGDHVMLTSLDYVAMENEDDSGPLRPSLMADHPGAKPMGAALDLLELRIVAATDQQLPAPVPTQLATLPAFDVGDCAVRRFRLGLDAQGQWRINEWNLSITGHEPVFSVQRGSREIWEIRNEMASMPHPIHIHGFQFRVVSRSISPPDIRARAIAPGGLSPHDLGLLDTVLIWPGETVRIALDFSQPFSGLQRYMLHCHNLEHEDMGMMITFAVTDKAAPAATC